MIFKSVSNISTKEKDDFIEKILIYIRIVEVIAEQKHLCIPISKAITEEMVQEIIDMGVIESINDLAILQKKISHYYQRFIDSISFYLANKALYGNQLDKLNNRKRKQLQVQVIKQNKPTFADFFAGAGGLSYGFTQAGYRVCFANDFEDVCVRTYRYNHPELPAKKVVLGDIRKIVDHIGDYIDESVDVVVGGPPCQGFSSANQQRIIDDPRNELYKS